MTDERGPANGTPNPTPPTVEDTASAGTPADRQLDAALAEAAESIRRAHRAIERARRITGNPLIDRMTGGVPGRS